MTCELFSKYGGGLGIRTPGRLQTYNGFQDRRLKPLSQSTNVLMLRIIVRPTDIASVM